MDTAAAGTDAPALTPLQIVAARVRAAIAYAALRVPEVAEKADIGEATLRRIISPTSPRGADESELWRIADACGVPRDFADRSPWDIVITHPDSDHITYTELKQLKPEDAKAKLGSGTNEQRLDVIEYYLQALLTFVAQRIDGGDLPVPPETQPSPPRVEKASGAKRARLPRAAGNGQASPARD